MARDLSGIDEVVRRIGWVWLGSRVLVLSLFVLVALSGVGGAGS
jgi:hypothetical protein